MRHSHIFNGKERYKMMLKFIKVCFFTAITFFSYNVLNLNSLECVSMNNQKCKEPRTNEIRPSEEPMKQDI